MTNETNTNSAPQEIDAALLDQVVGAAIAVPEIRKQEQSDKLTSEERKK
jgi:hypothetical protein